MSTRDSPGSKGIRCVRLTYHPCSAERQEIRGRIPLGHLDGLLWETFTFIFTTCLFTTFYGLVCWILIQDRECTYNVTLGRVLAVDKQYDYIFWVCVFILRGPLCNAHAPFCHVWPARIHYIFPPYLKNGTIFEKKKESYWRENVCFDFLYKFCSKHISF